MKNIDGSSPVWLWNGQPFPIPTSGMKILGSQLVSDERNAKGEVIAQTINRRQTKFDSVTFSYLKYDEWRWVVQNLAGFDGLLTYWDVQEDGIVTRRFYFGDSSAQPFEWDSANYQVAKPLSYINCSVNIIDMGY